MFSLFTRDEAFQVHNDPARVWVFLLPSVESFPFLSEARLRGLLRSAVCLRAALGPWLLVSGFSCLALRLHSPLPNRPSLPDSVFPCFVFPCFAGKHTSEPCTARIASLRLTQHSFDTEPATAQAQTQPTSCAAKQRSPSAAVRQDKGQGTHHGAACKRLKTSLASPCHERPRGDGLVQRTRSSVPEINATTSQL